MRLNIAVIVAHVLSVVLGAGLFGPKSGILELSARTFTNEVLYNGNVTAVLFYAPWCGHCRNLAPEWKQAAKSLRGVARVAAIDCDEDRNKPLCSKYDIKGFPTIKVFQPGKLTDEDFKDAAEGKPLKRRRPTMFSYSGERTASAITSFVVDKLRNYAASLDSNDKLLWLAPNKVPRVVMLPGKKYKAKSVSPLFKVLSREYFGKLRFAQIPRRIDGAWNLLGLEAPDESQLVYLSDDKAPVVYKGSMKKRDLKQFLDEQYMLEMSRRQHLGQSQTPDRDEAANGLEFVTEDAQEGELDHVRRRREKAEEQRRLAEEARKEAFERHGKTAPERKTTESAKTETTTAEPVSTGEPGVEVDEFEYTGPADDDDSIVDQEFEEANDDAILDEAVKELTPDQIIEEGPEAIASFMAAHNPTQTNEDSQTKTSAAAPRGTRTHEGGIVRYDQFVERCLRTGYSCVVVVTTQKQLNSDLIVVLRMMERLPKAIKRSMLFEYMLAEESEEIDEFLDVIGVKNRPGLMFWDSRKQRMAFFDEGWSQREIAAFITAAGKRKLKLEYELPAKYLYWISEAEVQREAEREAEKSVKDEL